MAKTKVETERKTFLILEWTSLPAKIKEVVKDWNGFTNDVLLRVEQCSEFDVDAYKQGKSSIEEYYKDQLAGDDNSEYKYEGTYEEFIEDYGLEFDVWFIEQNFNLDGVDEVAVNVCW